MQLLYRWGSKCAPYGVQHGFPEGALCQALRLTGVQLREALHIAPPHTAAGAGAASLSALPPAPVVSQPKPLMQRVQVYASALQSQILEHIRQTPRFAGVQLYEALAPCVQHPAAGAGAASLS